VRKATTGQRADGSPNADETLTGEGADKGAISTHPENRKIGRREKAAKKD